MTKFKASCVKWIPTVKYYLPKIFAQYCMQLTWYFTAIRKSLIAVNYHVNCMQYWARVYGIKMIYTFYLNFFLVSWWRNFFRRIRQGEYLAFAIFPIYFNFYLFCLISLKTMGADFVKKSTTSEIKAAFE